jgi:hypothetical protein
MYFIHEIEKKKKAYYSLFYPTGAWKIRMEK